MLVNLTSHSITIEGHGIIAPSGIIARVATIRIGYGLVDNVRITAQNFGSVDGLPSKKDGVVYIVSGMVLDAIKRSSCPTDRSRAGDDVFAPDTGPDAVRDSRGQIVAVLGLVC
jgi:hypothetical protein